MRRLWNSSPSHAKSSNDHRTGRGYTLPGNRPPHSPTATRTRCSKSCFTRFHFSVSFGNSPFDYRRHGPDENCLVCSSCFMTTTTTVFEHHLPGQSFRVTAIYTTKTICRSVSYYGVPDSPYLFYLTCARREIIAKRRRRIFKTNVFARVILYSNGIRRNDEKKPDNVSIGFISNDARRRRPPPRLIVVADPTPTAINDVGRKLSRATLARTVFFSCRENNTPRTP